MNAHASQFTTDFDGSTIREIFDLGQAESDMCMAAIRADRVPSENPAAQSEADLVGDLVVMQIRRRVADVMAGRLERGDRKKALLHLSDTTSVVAALINDLGAAPDDQVHGLFMAMIKPVVETSIKAYISDLKHDPHEGDLYEKAFARIRAYNIVVQNHPTLSKAELVASPAIRAEYYSLVETPESWDGKVKRAQRAIRALNLDNVFDESQAPQLEGQFPLDEMRADLKNVVTDTAKITKRIYENRKAEIWPKDK
ncbi:MAG: hypothetical protein JWM07_600 [Candidatus Saccharibacteria bacterium]|nr:hypothetical protein [Candidatus Saccharibacteria bacterium]